MILDILNTVFLAILAAEGLVLIIQNIGMMNADRPRVQYAALPDLEQAHPTVANRDDLVTQPPMVEGVTLYAWLVHHHPSREGAWAEVVDMFYTRAAANPEIATYFGGVDWERLQNHFLGALRIATGTGLSQRTIDTLAEKHADVRSQDGQPINTVVYDATIQVLVDILAEIGVPRSGIEQLAATIAPLRGVIAR